MSHHSGKQCCFFLKIISENNKKHKEAIPLPIHISTKMVQEKGIRKK